MCDAWKRLSKYRHQHVEILTTVKDTLNGVVHAVDPETGNLVLLSDDEGHNSGSDDGNSNGEIVMHLVIASAIREVNILSSRPPLHVQLPPLSNFQVDETSPAVVSITPQVLVDELRARRIDANLVEDECATEGSKSSVYIDIFSGVARILPPFQPQSVRSTNHNVLVRIRAVIQHIHDHVGTKQQEKS